MPHPIKEISLCIVVNERNRLSKSARCVSLALLHIHGLLDGFLKLFSMDHSGFYSLSLPCVSQI